jgi:hypothetical protein
MHKHHCDVTGHDYECSKGCECICGLPMEGNDHSDCPVELRACPEHKDETGQQVAEVEPGAVAIDFSILSSERSNRSRSASAGAPTSPPVPLLAFVCGVTTFM